MAAAIAGDAVRRRRGPNGAWLGRFARLTALILGQSLARLRGRLAGGLTPWRRRGQVVWAIPRTRRLEQWTQEWHSAEARLTTAEADLHRVGVAVARGGPTDRWDLEARTGAFGSARVLGTIEEHGHGRQLVRWRIWPRVWQGSLAAIVTLAAASAWAVLDGRPAAAAIGGLTLVVLVGRVVLDTGQGVEALARACGRSRPTP